MFALKHSIHLSLVPTAVTAQERHREGGGATGDGSAPEPAVAPRAQRSSRAGRLMNRRDPLCSLDHAELFSIKIVSLCAYTSRRS